MTKVSNKGRRVRLGQDKRERRGKRRRKEGRVSERRRGEGKEEGKVREEGERGDEVIPPPTIIEERE